MQACPILLHIKSNEGTHCSMLHHHQGSCLQSLCMLAIKQVTNDTALTIEEISDNDGLLAMDAVDLPDAGEGNGPDYALNADTQDSC